MPYITAKEDAGLSPDTTAEAADSFVPLGGRIGIDWIKPADNPKLATIRLAGPYTFPGGTHALEKGTVRFLNPSRFIIPDEAWIRSSQQLPELNSIPVSSQTPASISGLLPPEVAALNHHYEGCSLEAYRDPASRDGLPITIGWGSTFYKDGSKIQLGQTISQKEADELYDFNCYHRFWKVLEATVPFWGQMTNKQKAALCSFAYNNGAEFYGGPNHQTITRNLRERDWTAVPGTMMMYRNPSERVELGLGRRRRAEGLVWIGVEPQVACAQAEAEIQTLDDCERYEQLLKNHPPSLAQVGSPPPQAPPPAVSPPPPSTPQAPPGVARPNPLGIWMPPPGVTDFTIPVKHYTQCDNTGGRGYRECFKTTCTMLVDHITKGRLSQMQKERHLAEPEDAYQIYMDGDTTYPDVHIRALKKLGIDAYYTQTASINDVEASLDCGIPVPIGVKYKEGGHWVLINGRGPKGWDVLCPYGIRNGATDTWVQIFQTEADAVEDSFSLGLLKKIFTDLGPENGYAIFVTAVEGVPTGVMARL